MSTQCEEASRRRVTAYVPEATAAQTTEPPTEAIANPAEFEEARIRELLRERLFDPRKEIKEPPAVYRINGKVFATKGNILAIKGPEKAGKSAVIGAAIASVLSDGSADCDTLGFQSANPAGHLVLHLDCEQSEFHFGRMVNTVLRRARVDTKPEWLRSIFARGMSPRDIIAALKVELQDGAQRFGGIHSVWLDGFSDLVTNVNDVESVVPVILDLMGLSERYQTVIFGAIHENPSGGQKNASDKARGVLGSELQRKVETMLTIHTHGEGSYELCFYRNRNAPMPKGQGVRYAWSDTSGMFITDLNSAAEAKAARADELRKWAGRVIPAGSKIRFNPLKDALAKANGWSESKSKRVIGEMRDLGVLQVTAEKEYTLSD